MLLAGLAFLVLVGVRFWFWCAVVGFVPLDSRCCYAVMFQEGYVSRRSQYLLASARSGAMNI